MNAALQGSALKPEKQSFPAPTGGKPETSHARTRAHVMAAKAARGGKPRSRRHDMTATTPNWLDIGALTDIPARGGRVVRTPRGCIAVFRAADDHVFALDDRCPHKGGPLSDGIVHGHKVTCPLHNLVLSLETGEADNPADGSVRAHAVRVEGGRILLDAKALRT